MPTNKKPVRNTNKHSAQAKAEKKHIVRASVQIPELAKAGASMRFSIYAEREKLGEIVIGHGSFTWYGKRRKRGGKLDWTKFAQIMDDHFYRQ